jgi:hypothetical protein
MIWFSSQMALAQDDAASSFESSAMPSDETETASAPAESAGEPSDLLGSEATASAPSEDNGTTMAAISDGDQGATAEAKSVKKSKSKRARTHTAKKRHKVSKTIAAESEPESAPKAEVKTEAAAPVSQEAKPATAEKSTATTTEIANTSAVETTTVKAPEATSTPADAATAPGNFTSDGSPFTLSELGVVINPPKGWQVSTQTGSLSLVMREPAVANVAPGQIKYQRNITVAAIHKASPIDEKRAEQLKAELIRSFGSDPSVSDFKIMEHKFFNYHGNNDGLLVYSSLNIREFSMMQMHVLVSGQDKQFLMTYTDLANQFGTEKDPSFAAAWDSMVSIQVNGQAPSRIDQYKPYAITGASAFGLLLLGWFLRRRASNVDYKGAADELIDSEGSLTMGVTGATRVAKAKGSAVSAVSDFAAFSAFSGVSANSAVSDFSSFSDSAHAKSHVATKKPAKGKKEKDSSHLESFISNF